MERCVLRLDLATLDFNQVRLWPICHPSVRLCSFMWLLSNEKPLCQVHSPRHIPACGAWGPGSMTRRARLQAISCSCQLEGVLAAQVTRLCRMHQLHSALAFLFTRALSDYAAPAAELLLAHVHGLPPDSQGNTNGGRQQEWGTKTQTGYKLLVYLKCGLSGEAFPPGKLWVVLNSCHRSRKNNELCVWLPYAGRNGSKVCKVGDGNLYIHTCSILPHFAATL